MRKFNPYYSKKLPEDTILVYNAKVFEVLELGLIYPRQNKLKTVFTCESVTGTPRMCVYWGNKINLEVGDLVDMQGHFRNKTFIVFSVLIKKPSRLTQVNQESEGTK